jgi:oligopeptide/dipeptide ABC transporter ATP-binding protein
MLIKGKRWVWWERREPGKIVGGQIILGGKNVLELQDKQVRDIRGNEVSMIFQEPMTSLNPVFTCGSQIEEAVILHQKVSKKEARQKAIEMLGLVGIPAPEQRVREYPHQLSGGMRQRVMIAMALSCNPSLLLADEPTTALDVTIQAQILELLERLQRELHMAVIMITHDLGVIAEVASQVAVMYAGKIVEYAGVQEIFNTPRHPYTQGLLRSIPKLTESKDRLAVIPGMVPNPLAFPQGCKFHPRCPRAIAECRKAEPDLRELVPDHWVRCFRA